MSAAALAQTLASTLAEMILPSRCAGCNAIVASGAAFCSPCSETLEAIVDPCQRCGLANASPRCPRCIKASPAYRQVRTPYAYGGQLTVALKRLKFNGATQLARALGPLLLGCLSDLPPRAVVVPVPLHPRRLRQRGFNQATLLARPLARQLGLPLRCQALERRRDTAPQSQRSASARQHNVSGAFVARQREVTGRSMILVDDVITTGATAQACAEALRAAGAIDILAIALARAG